MHFEDADLKTAIPMAPQAGFMNSGQACIEGTRFLVSAHRLAEVEGLVVEEGAHLLTGGAGWFVKPTVFSRVSNQMTIAREEIFGPVLSIITYDNEDEALTIANDTPYGLQAYILSSDLQRAHTGRAHRCWPRADQHPGPRAPRALRRL